MIRFIDLTGRIYLDDEEKAFAFFDTTTDKFCEFSGNQYWDKLEDFKEDYTGNEIDRFLRLMPPSIVYSWKDSKISLNGKEFLFKQDKTITDWKIAFKLSTDTINYKKKLADFEKKLKKALEKEDFHMCEVLKIEIENLKNK